MPGTNLNLPIPSLSDNQTTVVTKTAQALTAINNDLAGKITPAQMTINSQLNMGGNSLSNVGGAIFNGSLFTNTPGAIWFSGEWFLADNTGIIQLTSNGTLNVAALSGIGGDYVSSNALISFDSANSRYRFFGASAANLVDLDARNVVVNGSLAKVTFGVDSSLVTNTTFNIKSVPGANVGLLAYDASASAVVDGSTVAISAGTTFSGGVTCNNTLTVNGLLSHPAWSASISHAPSPENNTVSPNFGTSPGGGFGSATVFNWSSWWLTSMGLRVTDKVQTILVRANNHATNAITVRVKRRPLGGVATVVPTTGNTTTTTGNVDLTVVVTTPVAIASREQWWVEIDANNATINDITMTWTQ